MKSGVYEKWISRLERLARAGLNDLPDPTSALTDEERRLAVDAFSDEMGNRRVIDEAILSRVYGVSPARLPAGAGVDSASWWALAEGHATLPRLEAIGSLTARRDDLGIEIWSEIELATLHAAWSVAIDRRDQQLIDRCLDACVWHVAELQPDNATGHAWAVHGFVNCAIERGQVEAEMHAESIVHACMMQRGVPDRLSALLLWDAANGLRSRSESASA